MATMPTTRLPGGTTWISRPPRNGTV
jgi:hypothetical protein